MSGTISRHIICSGQLFAQFFRSHPEELPEAERGQLQAQQAVRRLILSCPARNWCKFQYSRFKSSKPCVILRCRP